MKARHNLAGKFLGARSHFATRATFALLLSIVLGGCRHKVQPYTIPVAPPIALEPASLPPDALTIATEPPPDFGPPPAVRLPVPPPRRRTGPKEELATPPTPPVDESVPAAVAIGSLSTGQDSTPQIQQQARDVIASISRRISALPARIVETQKREVRQVRHFLDQAQQALSTGDMEGAKNLATKAGLLMDGLEKK